MFSGSDDTGGQTKGASSFSLSKTMRQPSSKPARKRFSVPGIHFMQVTPAFVRVFCLFMRVYLPDMGE
jgi:hypothetical protein